jgi:hypothetical protein
MRQKLNPLAEAADRRKRESDYTVSSARYRGNAVMMVGNTFKRRGQKYECTDRFGYERPACFMRLYTLVSRCPDCARRFTFTASITQINKGQLVRRCEHCRDPGRPVELPSTKAAAQSKSAAQKRRKRAPLAKAATRRRLIAPQTPAKPAPQVLHSVSQAPLPELADQTSAIVAPLPDVGTAAADVVAADTPLADSSNAGFDLYSFALGLDGPSPGERAHEAS